MAIFVLKKFLPLYTPKINFFKIAIDSIVPTDNTIALYSEYDFQVYLLEMVWFTWKHFNAMKKILKAYLLTKGGIFNVTWNWTSLHKKL